MDDNQPTSDELVAVAALLEQKRQAAINYQENRRTRAEDRNRGNGGSTNSTQGPLDLRAENQRRTTTLGGRNQLGEILDT
ncbi:hypothetical protein H4Q26_007890 [Puccinia striiformis f. sp. tritici PST-130]|nr:hypothetical protein Pst134EB_021900 [Puccinia striiformis f. sp. tritici]KAI9612731.1 hypothetical protein H4Q26_007890 [Puccinia striiformis f. sp. tritici PST-130]